MNISLPTNSGTIPINLPSVSYIGSKLTNDNVQKTDLLSIIGEMKQEISKEQFANNQLLSNESCNSNSDIECFTAEQPNISDASMSLRTRTSQQQSENIHQEKETTPKKKWSLLEKSKVLQGLKLFGLKNMKGIADMVQTKNEKQVKLYLMFVLKTVQSQANRRKKTAYFHSRKKERKLLGLKRKNERAEPLKKCEKIALQLNNIKQCMLKSQINEPQNSATALARALMMISKFENHPPPSTCDGIDFSSVYAFLSKAVTNQYRISKAFLCNNKTKCFMRDCFLELIDMVPTDGIICTIQDENSNGDDSMAGD